MTQNTQKRQLTLYLTFVFLLLLLYFMDTYIYIYIFFFFFRMAHVCYPTFIQHFYEFSLGLGSIHIRSFCHIVQILSNKLATLFKCYHELSSSSLLDIEMMKFQERTWLVHHYTVESVWGLGLKKSHIIDDHSRLSSIRPYS